MTSPARRLLLVHAHPDDETITCGATMAKYAAQGAGVTLVTCTLGEEGEVLVPDLAHLASDREDRLGAHRVRELRAATSALGVGDLRFLGGQGRWRDSGMMGSASNDRSDCFWRADVAEAAAALVAVIREVRPQVVVTYDPQGGYGHPDHIQAHRVTMRAVDEAAEPGRPELGPAWRVDKVYWPCVPESVAHEDARRLREAGDGHGFTVTAPPDEQPAFVVPDHEVTAAVDAADHLEAKCAALQAHATQVTVEGPFFALSNNVGQVVWGTEYYRLARGEPGAVRDGLGRETDLFSDTGRPVGAAGRRAVNP